MEDMRKQLEEALAKKAVADQPAPPEPNRDSPSKSFDVSGAAPARDAQEETQIPLEADSDPQVREHQPPLGEQSQTSPGTHVPPAAVAGGRTPDDVGPPLHQGDGERPVFEGPPVDPRLPGEGIPSPVVRLRPDTLFQAGIGMGLRQASLASTVPLQGSNPAQSVVSAGQSIAGSEALS